MLVCKWNPHLRLIGTHRRCNASEATAVLVRGLDNSLSPETIAVDVDVPYDDHIDCTAISGVREYRHFAYRYEKFFLDASTSRFVPLEYKVERQYREIHSELGEGLSAGLYAARLHRFGPNLVDVQLKSPLVILLDEVACIPCLHTLPAYPACLPGRRLPATHLHTCTRTRAHAHTHTHAYARIFTHMHVYAYARTHTHARIRTHAYARMHMHARTHVRSPARLPARPRTHARPPAGGEPVLHIPADERARVDVRHIH